MGIRTYDFAMELAYIVVWQKKAEGTEKNTASLSHNQTIDLDRAAILSFAFVHK